GGSVTKASLEELNNFDVFTYSIGKAVPEALELMMGSVDAESLEELLFGNCKDHKLLLRLLYAFCYTEDREPGYSIIKRHEDEWIELDSYGVPFAPDVAVRLAFKGNVILQHPGLAWQEWAYALQAVFDLDQEAARKVLRDNKDQVAEGLLLRQSNMVEGLGEFLDTADMIDSNFIESILSDLSFSERAESYWPSRAEGEEGEVVAVSLLEARTNR
ncbi:MAG: hypothetical protein LBH87_01960, partial [Coriobacteriales bacterium]|nr:hypothetical protein [Coriobacteriales bacterium]